MRLRSATVADKADRRDRGRNNLHITPHRVGVRCMHRASISFDRLSPVFTSSSIALVFFASAKQTAFWVSLRTLLINLLDDIPDTWPILVVSTWETKPEDGGNGGGGGALGDHSYKMGEKSCTALGRWEREEDVFRAFGDL